MEPQAYRLSDIIATYRRRHELPAFDLVLDWFCQACRALGELHAMGVVHGGIRPEVIIIGQDGRVLIDRETGAAPRQTVHADGISGQGGDEDAMSGQPGRRMVERIDDLHNLGAAFFELLTLMDPSRRPRPPRSPILLTLMDPAPTLRLASAVNITVPAAFDEILDRLMMPALGYHYANAEEVLAAVEAMKGAMEREPSRTEGEPSIGAGTNPGPIQPGASRAAKVFAGALIGVAVGAIAGFALELFLPAALVVGSVTGAVAGRLAGPKV